MNNIVKKILLVEDNPDDEELTIRAINKTSLELHIDVVRDGAEAIDYILRQGSYQERDINDVPHVILLDLKLPKLSGLEVLERLRQNEQTKYVPVIILTTSDEQSDLVESHKLGANSYIRKPVNFETFLDTVQRIGVYWTRDNIQPRR